MSAYVKNVNGCLKVHFQWVCHESFRGFLHESSQDFPASKVPISYHQLSLGSFTASVATTAVPQTPMEELEEETDRGDGWGMLSIVQGVIWVCLAS